jgi:hypothetical protein
MPALHWSVRGPAMLEEDHRLADLKQEVAKYFTASRENAVVLRRNGVFKVRCRMMREVPIWANSKSLAAHRNPKFVDVPYPRTRSDSRSIL